MSSRNAFADGDNHDLHTTNGSGEQRPAKRARLADDAFASIYNQGSNTDTSLEVDHMILDYIVHQTIESCLASRNAAKQTPPTQSLSYNLAMSDAFIAIFKARHPSYIPDPELRLRLLLLKLVTLFTQRLTRNPTTPPRDALQLLRHCSQARARRWIGEPSRVPSATFDAAMFDHHLPIMEDSLERSRVHVLHQLDIPPEDDYYEDAFYGTSACVSLLDVIPLFMQVSAARNAMNESNLTATWMQLASELMLHACLEQYLVFGGHGTDAIDEAFAWGYRPLERDRLAESNGLSISQSPKEEVNSMFEDEEYEDEVEGWADVKMSTLRLLFPPDPAGASQPTDGLVAHLEQITAQRPVVVLESQLFAYLSALSKSISEPILKQLAAGRLVGMTPEETNEFLAVCGVGVSDVSSCTMLGERFIVDQI